MVKDVEKSLPQARSRPPSALEAVREIHAHAGRRKLAWFLDYDGTLTPIADRPEQAMLSGTMRRILHELALRSVVAIISGRDRTDVERHVGLSSLCYAGSHGFDIAGPPGRGIRHEPAVDYLPDLDRAEAALQARLEQIHGVLIERKKYSVAVHYRLVADRHLQEVGRAVDAVLNERPTLRKKGGRKICELQPAIDWDKGKAVRWLLRTLTLPLAEVYPLYLGDDLTDEDAFHALAAWGAGIIVGEMDRPTAARFALKDPEEVRRFLERVSTAEREGAQAAHSHPNEVERGLSRLGSDDTIEVENVE